MPKFIRHYTNVKALFSILEGGLKFGKPRDDWDDLNDTYSLRKYGDMVNKDIYLICFCGGLGNVHHWMYYGSNSSSMFYEHCYENIKCNIKFDAEKFKQKIPKEYRFEAVKYAITNESASIKSHHEHQTLKEVLKTIEDLPLIKRSEYEIEKEWRILAHRDKNTEEPENIKDIMDSIVQITFLLEEDSDLYSLLENKITQKYSSLKGKIKSSGVHKSFNWQNEINHIINNNFK